VVRMTYLGIENPQEQMAKLLLTLALLSDWAAKFRPADPKIPAFKKAELALQELSVALTGLPLTTPPPGELLYSGNSTPKPHASNSCLRTEPSGRRPDRRPWHGRGLCRPRTAPSSSTPRTRA
jgi:hypothetical protein